MSFVALFLISTIVLVGHSLVSPTLPDMMNDILGDWDQPRTVEYQVINGATIWANWDHSHNAEGVDARRRLAEGDVDVLVLTEAIPLLNHTTWSQSHRYALEFYQLAQKSNPGTRVYLYETWHSLDSGTGIDVLYDDNDHIPWRQRIDDDRSLWEGIVDHVNDARDPQAPTMRIIPAGQAMAQLHDEIERGKVPELQSIRDVFRDDIHPNHLGHYFIAMVHYAAIFGESPEGLPLARRNQWGSRFDTPSPALAARLQQIAWEAVTTYAASGEH